MDAFGLEAFAKASGGPSPQTSMGGTKHDQKSGIHHASRPAVSPGQQKSAGTVLRMYLDQFFRSISPKSGDQQEMKQRDSELSEHLSTGTRM